MTVTGTLKRVNFGAPAWVVVGDDGKKYQLLDDPAVAEEGARVVVEGEVDREVMTFNMAGRPFRATSMRKA